MEETFRLGRIAGVRVRVNWSVLVTFALIAYGLAGGTSPYISARDRRRDRRRGRRRRHYRGHLLRPVPADPRAGPRGGEADGGGRHQGEDTRP